MEERQAIFNELVFRQPYSPFPATGGDLDDDEIDAYRKDIVETWETL